MMYAVIFDPSIKKTLKKWKKSNPIFFNKIEKLIFAIAENPREGIGHPEPLVGGADNVYSRRISANDRLIYTIFDEEVYVLVIEIQGHYKDK